MNTTILQTISTIAIMVLLCITGYLSMRQYRATFVATGQLIMRWFSFLLLFIFIGRIMVLFSVSLAEVQRLVSSAAFFITVIGIAVSVGRYERSNKR